MIGLLGGFLWRRLPDLIGGKAMAFDALAFVILVCLALSPIFSEMTLLGFSVKQQIESVKAHLDKQLQTLRAEFQNSVDVRSQFNPNITFSAPPPDTRLPEIEVSVQRAVENAMRTFGVRGADARVAPTENVPPENVELFTVRYTIERELQRIWGERFGLADDNPARPVPMQMVVQLLVKAGLISPELGHAIREVYSVCSAAIHGVVVSQAKVSFVREVSAGLITTLRAV